MVEGLPAMCEASGLIPNSEEEGEGEEGKKEILDFHIEK